MRSRPHIPAKAPRRIIAKPNGLCRRFSSCLFSSYSSRQASLFCTRASNPIWCTIPPPGLSVKRQVYATHDLAQVISIVPARALFMLSLYANYALTGMDPYYFRLTNTVILAGAGLALAWLIFVILEVPTLRAPGTPLEKRAISLFLGLMFIAHPLQTYVVLYDWQREAIMACLFYFSALAVYLGARSGRFRNEGLGYVLTAVLFFAGLQSKENLITLPIMMLLAEIVLISPELQGTAQQVLDDSLADGAGAGGICSDGQ